MQCCNFDIANRQCQCRMPPYRIRPLDLRSGVVAAVPTRATNNVLLLPYHHFGLQGAWKRETQFECSGVFCVDILPLPPGPSALFLLLQDWCSPTHMKKLLRPECAQPVQHLRTGRPKCPGHHRHHAQCMQRRATPATFRARARAVPLSYIPLLSLVKPRKQHMTPAVRLGRAPPVAGHFVPLTTPHNTMRTGRAQPPPGAIPVHTLTASQAHRTYKASNRK